MQARSLDGTEWTCLQCGHLDYGIGFVALTDEEEGKQRRRQPSHGGAAL